jgi:cell wall-associated NlpC family hydrolase
VRLSPRNRTMSSTTRSTAPRSITTRITALIATLVAIAITAGIAVTASSAARAQQPVASVVSVASVTRTAVVPSVDFTSFNRSINSGLAAAHRVQAATVTNLRMRVVDFAKAQIGDRYVAGAAGPNRFDCSGLTRYVFKSVVGKELPHQSHAQYARVKKISKKQARPGDLVFFFRRGAHHVGIYIGGNKMVDAVGYGSGVRVSPISGSWWSATYSGMGRVLPA